MRWLRWLLLFVVLAACVSNHPENVTPASLSLPTEEPFYAWDFTMEAVDGEIYTLSELRGGWVLVNFWATWCGPCRDEMPVLQQIHDQYDNLTVLGINQRESPAQITAYLEQIPITFPILLDPPDQVLLDYNVVSLPQTLIVNPDGIIVWRQFGPVELETFAVQVGALAAER